MNKCLFSALLCGLSTGLAVANDTDSLRVEELGEVVVKGVKAQEDAPFAVANIKKQQLDVFSKTARELPFLFAQTPGIVAWSENGVGTGTTYMRLRGASGSRINVTLDGVQLNSPEDQCVFWANMNSYSTFLNNAQIQRGVGTSTNGDGAFGGSIALTTKNPSLTPEAEISASFGSYNTSNAGGSFSSGLLWKHMIIDGAFHHTATDGFMHGTSGKSGSYYGALTWMADNLKLSYKNIGNYERTGQAWNGLDTGDLLDGNYGAQTGLNSYKDFWNAGIGRFNSLYEYMNDPYDPAKGTSRYQAKDGRLWPKATDNYWQDHNILAAALELSEKWKTSATLHYSYDYGYYDEFKKDCKLSKFGLTWHDANGAGLKKSDFVRKKGMEEHTYGALWNLNYRDSVWDMVGGISAQRFTGDHFGYLTYVGNNGLAAALLRDGSYRYYLSDAKKDDANVYAKAAYSIDEHWKAFLDMQYRFVHYTTNGQNDKFIATADGYENQRLDINEKNAFFNPKAGVNFSLGSHRAYASVAVSHREPERNNYTDNGSYPLPKAERVVDFELGYSYVARNWNIGVNAYYMKYDNQLVQTGEVSDIGEALTTNIKDSYRLGLEITAAWKPAEWLDIYGNTALSRNRIKDFDEVVEDWDNGYATFHYDNSTLAFSPATILNGFFTVSKWGLQATWHTNFVSRQYLDNSQCDQRSLPSYSQSNISANYAFNMKRTAGIREIIVGASLNNVFDAHYAASGWVYSAIFASGGHTNDNRYRQIGFIPMAGRNFMVNITIKF